VSAEIDLRIDAAIDAITTVRRFDAQIYSIEFDLKRGLGREDVLPGSRQYGWLKRELVAERKAKNAVLKAADARLAAERKE
jgi:hypothetical protein